MSISHLSGHVHLFPVQSLGGTQTPVSFKQTHVDSIRACTCLRCFFLASHPRLFLLTWRGERLPAEHPQKHNPKPISEPTQVQCKVNLWRTEVRHFPPSFSRGTILRSNPLYSLCEDQLSKLKISHAPHKMAANSIIHPYQTLPLRVPPSCNLEVDSSK